MYRSKVFAAFAIALFAAGALVAQTGARTDYQLVVPCPHPVTITRTAPSSPPTPPTPDPATFTGVLGTAVAGSVWNQTAADKGFGHTFYFPKPGKECCLMTRATLTVTIKALQTGPPKSASSANDWVQLVSNGASVPGFAQQPFIGGVTVVGQTATATFTNIPQNLLNTGMLSFYVQDDSAVVSAQLKLEGCCLQ